MLKNNSVFPAIILLLILPFAAFSQGDNEETEFTPRHQVGVNTTFFFKQFLNFTNNNAIAVSPYVITYKAISRSGNAFRMGIGGTFNNRKEEDDNQVPRITNAYELDLSLGYEYRKSVSKSWLCFFGLDAVTHLANSKTVANDGFDETTTITKNNRFGAGPLMGIQLNISKRVSLFTETAIIFSYTSGSFESKFKNNPVFDSKETISETGINFVIPTSVFLAVNL